MDGTTKTPDQLSPQVCSGGGKVGLYVCIRHVCSFKLCILNVGLEYKKLTLFKKQAVA